ncbi:hypothetical protein PCANB_000636 [Pneumocystis canis]|nr:hypothetical protein PCK1_000694 [Pneumocystis canis]KAG5437599.1 hypothetical protein PCANB_000636 [Pneumocystis canis]
MTLNAFTQPLGLIICFIYAFLYVFILYLPSTNVNLVSRNTPTTIRKRLKAISCLCVLCGLTTTWVTQPSYTKFLQHFLFILGIWPCKGWDIIRPLILVLCLFLGPFIKKIALTRRPFILHPSTMLLSFSNHKNCYWIGLRNYLAGPFSEEFVFRSCMIPLLYQVSTWRIIMSASLLFGIAHIHHLYEYYLSHPNDLKSGFFIYFFQLFYTTIFGGFASYLYLCTQNLWSIVIVHAFCNWMGFPQLYGPIDASRSKTVIYYTTLLLGVIGFIIFFKQLTQPSNISSFN